MNVTSHSGESVAKEGDTSATKGQTVCTGEEHRRCCSGRGLKLLPGSAALHFPPKYEITWSERALCFSLPPVIIRFLIYYIYIFIISKEKRLSGYFSNISLTASEFFDCRQDVGSLRFPQILWAGLLWKSGQMCARG